MAAGMAAAHSAGSGCQGPGRVVRCGERLAPCRPGCEPGLHLHKRQGSRTTGTTASSSLSLWEGTGS